MTLYEIDFQIKKFLDNLMDSVDEETGEVLDIDPSELEALNEARQKKLEKIALYIKNLDADAKAIKEEEKNLKERRERVEKKAERLRKLLSDSILNAGDDHFETSRCSVTFRASDTVEIDDLDLIDDVYIKVVTDYKPDKTALKKAIKAGIKIDGCHLESHNNIQIK
jgi:seryl-tRNA synthetase